MSHYDSLRQEHTEKQYPIHFLCNKYVERLGDMPKPLFLASLGQGTLLHNFECMLCNLLVPVNVLIELIEQVHSIHKVAARLHTRDPQLQLYVISLRGKAKCVLPEAIHQQAYAIRWNQPEPCVNGN